MKHSPVRQLRLGTILSLCVLASSSFCHSVHESDPPFSHPPASSYFHDRASLSDPIGAVAALYHHYHDDTGRIVAGAWDDGSVVLVDFAKQGQVTAKLYQISALRMAELKRSLKYKRLRPMLHEGDPLNPTAGNWVMVNHSGQSEYWKWDEVFTTWPVKEGQSYRFEVYKEAWLLTEAAIKESIRDKQPARVIKVSNEAWKRGFDPLRLTKPDVMKSNS